MCSNRVGDGNPKSSAAHINHIGKKTIKTPTQLFITRIFTANAPKTQKNYVITITS
jgi:hypothetical protein